jgi:aminoglycoside phosphotransferase (APT) family kinase protein
MSGITGATEDHDERDAGELVDPERLGAWMDAQGLPEPGVPVTFTSLAGGSQNAIFEIRRGDFRAALRRPPLNPPPKRAEGIAREWRVIAALRGTDVPHTEAIAMCDDPSVLGDVFYLMGFVDGWSPSDGGWRPPFDTDADARRELGFQLIDGVAKLGSVDWRARGLGDFGRPDGFHERQVDRWISYLERVKSRELPGLDEATRWLQTHGPIDYVPGIMHGDFQLANVMFGRDMPPRLEAIIDWEMTTIGDPKLDLGWVVQSAPDPSRNETASSMFTQGLPDRPEMVERYAQASGRQVDDIDYYVILARWKLAIVLEQGYQRLTAGLADNEKLHGFGDLVLDLMRRAAELAESSTYVGPRPS